ncbi:unnamed protein product, partial [Cladocopium goreaui]
PKTNFVGKICPPPGPRRCADHLNRCMLSLSYPLRKPCSGDVGGPNAAFKVGPRASHGHALQRQRSAVSTALNAERPRSAASSQPATGVASQVSGSRLSGRSSSLSRLTYQSSRPSQAVRSTVLDLELMLERERREAVERELAELKEKLALLTGAKRATPARSPSGE